MVYFPLTLVPHTTVTPNNLHFHRCAVFPIVYTSNMFSPSNNAQNVTPGVSHTHPMGFGKTNSILSSQSRLNMIGLPKPIKNSMP